MLPAPPRILLALGLAFGTAFVFLTPPLQAPDEWMHFRRAYMTSGGCLRARLLPSPATGKDSACGEFPVGFLVAEKAALFSLHYAPEREAEIAGLQGLTEDPFAAGVRFQPGRVLSLLRQPAGAGSGAVLCFPNTALHPPHLYFPQALGIALGRMLGAPTIALVYLGRLGNLALWLVLVFLAIRSLPAFRWLFLLIALTPTSLFQAASLSADALTNGLSLLLAASFLRLAYGKAERSPGLPFLLALSALVSVSKLSFPLVLLCLLVPRERWGSPERQRRALLATAGCAALALLAWGLYAKGLYTPLRRVPPVSPQEQLQQLLLHPLAYAGVLWRTLTLKLPHYLVTFVGQLGHFQLRLPAAMAAFHILAMSFVAAVEDAGDIRIPSADKLKLAAIAAVASLWVLSTQYLSWTTVGAGVIEGVYGRYFIPIAPLFLLLFQGLRVAEGRLAGTLPAAVVGYICMLLSYAAYTLTFYWGS